MKYRRAIGDWDAVHNFKEGYGSNIYPDFVDYVNNSIEWIVYSRNKKIGDLIGE